MKRAKPSLFAGTLSMPAALVNESRARRVDLSGDRFARAWIPTRQRGAVSELWNEYASKVYPDDDIVLSVRNRFFLNLIEEHGKQNTDCIIVPSGLTSYPYLTGARCAFFELDLSDLINYKRRRAALLLNKKSLPNRMVSRHSIDLLLPCSLSSYIFKLSARRKRLIIMEGISYYIRSDIWWSILYSVKSALSKGDVIAFDYWPKRESQKPIYDRYLEFCKINGGYTEKGFNFIDEKEIGQFGNEETVSRVSVSEYETKAFNTKYLKGRPILKDTMAVFCRTQD